MKRSQFLSGLFRGTTGLAASSPVIILLLFTVILVADAAPAFRYQGLSVLTSSTWNMGNLYANSPVVVHGVKALPGASFGILPLIVGTLGSSLIALLIGVPISLLTAVILVYKVPTYVERWISPWIELLAGIPSVVYGLWGIAVIAPFVQHVLGPMLVPFGTVFPFLAGPVGTGLGLLTSGIVLAVMIIPIVTATTRDLLSQVPLLPREGALAIGMTSYEMVRYVSFPWARKGIVGAVILGWGRALGETMAVLMVSGNAVNFLPATLYSPISSMASAIAGSLDSALTDFTGMSVHALAMIALVLLVMTLMTNLMARLLVSLGRRDVGVEG